MPRWSDREARNLSGPALCAYISRLIGADPGLVLHGGGNSSIKTIENDHAGRPVRTLWIKASGFDMGVITERGFSPLRLDDLLLLIEREAMTDEEMVEYQMKCLLDPKAPKPSIETLLHAFIPADHVYHTHADAIGALTSTPDSGRTVRQALGEGVLWIPYIRPGFALSKKVGLAVRENPKAWAVVLDKHGAITWGQTGQQAYEAMNRLVGLASRYGRTSLLRVSVSQAHGSAAGREKALRLLPVLRGAVSSERRVLLTWNDSRLVMDFLNLRDAERLSQRGPFSPDHILHTKARPLFLRLPETEGPRRLKQTIHREVDRYRLRYREYFRRCAPAGSRAMDPNPRLILIPGIGLVSSGSDARSASIPLDIYLHTIAVIRKAESLSRYSPLGLNDLCQVEYWPMENDKLKLLPPEKEFSRQVVVVTGAAGAIGAAIARRFCETGAHVVLADMAVGKSRLLESELNGRYGRGRALTVAMDVTDPGSVRRGFEKAVLSYGGLDGVVSNAGIAKSAPVDRLSLEDWEANFKVNATGHFLVSREAVRILKAQGLGGFLVFIASKNVLAPGKEFAAYSASKAAQAQLARVLALEGGEHGIRVNIINPDAVFEGSGLWSPQVRRARAKAQGIPAAQLEDHYVQRNLLKTRILPQDVAEAALFLCSGRASKTTGAILPVDGGLREAFPR